MIRSVALPLAVALLATGCADSGERRMRAAQTAEGDAARLRRELAGLVPGAETTCLPPLRQTNVRAYGSTLVYRVSSAQKYRVDTNGGCEGLSTRDDILVTTSNLSHVCSGDIARTVDRNSGFVTGTCVIGRFVTYGRPRGRR